MELGVGVKVGVGVFVCVCVCVLVGVFVCVGVKLGVGVGDDTGAEVDCPITVPPCCAASLTLYPSIRLNLDLLTSQESNALAFNGVLVLPSTCFCGE